MTNLDMAMAGLKGCSLGAAGDPGGVEKKDTSLKEAAVELECLFIEYLLKEMRATIPKSGLLSGGKAEDMYTSMMDHHLARELAMKGGIGISSLLMNELDRQAQCTGGKSQKMHEIAKVSGPFAD